MELAMVRLLVLLVLLVVPAWSAFLVEETALTVTSPESLKGTHQSAIGNFGIPQYGGTLGGTVVYPDLNAKACDFFPKDKFKSGPGMRPIFALVDRGGMYAHYDLAMSRPLELKYCYCMLGCNVAQKSTESTELHPRSAI